MQRILLLIFSSVFLLLQVRTSSDIVGRWEAMETTRGGLGSTLEFNRDGSFSFGFGPLYNGTYKLVGNKLIITTFQYPPAKSIKEVHEIKIEGDALLDKAKDGVEKMIRLSSPIPSKSPIVGVWGTKTPMYEFRRDGSFDIDEIHNGTYKLNGNQLYLTYPSRGAKKIVTDKSEIEIKEETLMWRQDDRPNMAMRRISPGNAEGPAIIGKWRIILPDGTDNLSYTEYKANGQWAFRMFLSKRKGRYSIERDLLTTTFEDEEVKISRFGFERGNLVLKSPPEEGPVDKFKRIE